jgi:hypothetical protein
MYTQQVVCPNCSKMANVNIIDKAGSTHSKCQHCNKEIYVSTNTEGQVTSISGEACLIATACLSIQADTQKSATELDVIRRYRETYIREQSFGLSLLDEYYRIAPVILSAIRKKSECNDILSRLYESHIGPAARLIQNNQYENALELYYDLINMLKKKYLEQQQSL